MLDWEVWTTITLLNTIGRGCIRISKLMLIEFRVGTFFPAAADYRLERRYLELHGKSSDGISAFRSLADEMRDFTADE